MPHRDDDGGDRGHLHNKHVRAWGKTTRAAQIARFRREADSQADERPAVQNGGDVRGRYTKAFTQRVRPWSPRRGLTDRGSYVR